MDVIGVWAAVGGWWIGGWLVRFGWFLCARWGNGVLAKWHSSSMWHPAMEWIAPACLGGVCGFVTVSRPGLPESAVAMLLFGVLLVVTITDLHLQWIPDMVIYPATLLFAILRLWVGPHPWTDYLTGCLAGGSMLAVLAWISKGIGWGDVKLLGMAGWVLGWPAAGVALWLSVLVGGMTALWWWVTGRVRAGEAIPFGPFLAAGIITAYFWGDAWAAWYGSLLTGSIFSSKTIYMW